MILETIYPNLLIPRTTNQLTGFLKIMIANTSICSSPNFKSVHVDIGLGKGFYQIHLYKLESQNIYISNDSASLLEFNDRRSFYLSLLEKKRWSL